MRNRAETTRVEAVDFARGGGLRNGAGERFAGRCTAAGVGVIAHAGNPSARRLGGSGAHEKQSGGREGREDREQVD